MSVLGKAVEALKEVDGQMFICADHGNAEQLVIMRQASRDCSYHQSGTVHSWLMQIRKNIHFVRTAAWQTSSDSDSAYGHGAAS